MSNPMKTLFDKIQVFGLANLRMVEEAQEHYDNLLVDKEKAEANYEAQANLADSYRLQVLELKAELAEAKNELAYHKTLFATALESVERLLAEETWDRGTLRKAVLRAAKADAEIDTLATVLLMEFEGPTQNESACEMAVRVLREQRAELAEAGKEGVSDA